MGFYCLPSSGYSTLCLPYTEANYEFLEHRKTQLDEVLGSSIKCLCVCQNILICLPFFSMFSLLSRMGTRSTFVLIRSNWKLKISSFQSLLNQLEILTFSSNISNYPWSRQLYMLGCRPSCSQHEAKRVALYD